MAESQGWSAGKIVLVIVLVLVVVVGLCCGGVYLVAGDWIKAGAELAQVVGPGMQRFNDGMGAAVDPEAVFELRGDGQDLVLLIGLPEAPEGAEVTRIQDAVWRHYAESFADGGFPVVAIGVGRAKARVKGGQAHQGKVEGWRENQVSTETVAERTGVPAPPVAEFFEKIGSMVEKGESMTFEPIDEDGVSPEEDSPEEDTPGEGGD